MNFLCVHKTSFRQSKRETYKETRTYGQDEANVFVGQHVKEWKRGRSSVSNSIKQSNFHFEPGVCDCTCLIFSFCGWGDLAGFWLGFLYFSLIPSHIYFIVIMLRSLHGWLVIGYLLALATLTTVQAQVYFI